MRGHPGIIAQGTAKFHNAARGGDTGIRINTAHAPVLLALGGFEFIHKAGTLGVVHGAGSIARTG